MSSIEWLLRRIEHEIFWEHLKRFQKCSKCGILLIEHYNFAKPIDRYLLSIVRNSETKHRKHLKHWMFDNRILDQKCSKKTRSWKILSRWTWNTITVSRSGEIIVPKPAELSRHICFHRSDKRNYRLQSIVSILMWNFENKIWKATHLAPKLQGKTLPRILFWLHFSCITEPKRWLLICSRFSYTIDSWLSICIQ